MAIPRSMGWLIVTGAVVVALLGLSFLALDKQDVTWSAQKPSCPHCRSAVPMYARRCPSCREEFDWVPAPDEESPWCMSCLTPGEDDALRERKMALGEEVAAKRVADALHLPLEAAKEYLRGVGRGQCGWCGGTGKDPGAASKEPVPCPVCFGERRCISCDGDRHVRLGFEPAGREIERYGALVRMLTTPYTPVATSRRGLEEADRAFLHRFAGTVEASELLFWPTYREPDGASPTPARAVDVARQRLTTVLRALQGD